MVVGKGFIIHPDLLSIHREREGQPAKSQPNISFGHREVRQDGCLHEQTVFSQKLAKSKARLRKTPNKEENCAIIQETICPCTRSKFSTLCTQGSLLTPLAPSVHSQNFIQHSKALDQHIQDQPFPKI